MGSLTIRALDDEVKANLRVRAARHGRSMEAEARAILGAALAGGAGSPGLGTRIAQRFGPDDAFDVGVRRTDPPRAVGLDE